MNGFDQNTDTPMMAGASAAAGGSPNRAPSSAPPKNQARIRTMLQAAADKKNIRGCGKNDTNTGKPSLLSEPGGSGPAGIKSQFSYDGNVRTEPCPRRVVTNMANLAVFGWQAIADKAQSRERRLDALRA